MIQVRYGQVIGRDHLAKRTNAQDALAFTTHNNYAVGVVCDGCGEGQFSEVGARLASQFMVAEVGRLLAAGVLLNELPFHLHSRVIGFLRGIIANVQPLNPAEFLLHNLLFTIVGAVVTDSGGVIFTAGDGLFQVDDHMQQINQSNQPDYIAYCLVDPSQLGGYTPPAGFVITDVPADWSRLVIASDGFEPELLHEVWGINHPRGLQRKLNVWSDQSRRFRDDASIIVFEKVQGDD